MRRPLLLATRGLAKPLDGAGHVILDLVDGDVQTASDAAVGQTAYNFAKQLKALKFRTPYEAVEELWKSKPVIFIVKPNHHMLGLNT